MDMQFFPAELKSLPQWCVASLLPGEDGKEDKRPYDPKTGNAASVTDPRTWGTFEQAMELAAKWRSSTAPRAIVGFVFNENDPYAVIDLDTYKAKVDGVKQLHAEILRHALTYTELSQSGLGTHIIGRGLVLDGARNEANCVELYSHARFMICTGNVGTGGTIAPIADIQPLLDYLYGLIKDGGRTDVVNWRDLGDGEESLLSDGEIVERAMNAQNADKFLALCQGDLSLHGGDWSRADEALMQFFCFYTPDNNQVARLFMRSKLAEREKAERPDYVPRTIAYARAKIENDKPPPLDHSAIMARAQAVAEAAIEPPAMPDAPVSAIDVAPAISLDPNREFTYPPGLVGEIARYVLAAAIRPVPEIALAASIAAMAGIVGRQFNTYTASGLNQYVLLLAKTGTGKESAQSGIDRLFGAVRKGSPLISRFIGPGYFASGQALFKQFSTQPCFVSVIGEFGHRMKALTHPRANAADKMLMSIILDAFNKSGDGQQIGASSYSNKENNTDVVVSPGLTILAETEPEGFFSGLDDAMITSGFLPRFLVIEYTGGRPPRNKTPLLEPAPELVQKVGDLVQSTIQLEQNRQCFIVPVSPEARAILDAFDVQIDGNINNGDNITAELWNRAHLKAIRLASLIAVGCDFYSPLVTAEHAQWAVTTVVRDTMALYDRFQAGDVGDGDSKMRADMVRILKKYFTKGIKGEEKYFARGAVSSRYLTQRTSGLVSYTKSRLGQAASTKNVLDGMVSTGELYVWDKKVAHEQLKTTGLVYSLGDMWNPDR